MVTPNRVMLYEVGPRDGLQNEPAFVRTDDKIELINRLSKAGFRHIEVSSFVNPRWIPALSDAAEVFAGIERLEGVCYSALVPNEQGLERALAANVGGVNVFLSASETHNRKNINKSIQDSFSILETVISTAKQVGLPVRGYVSTVFGCPYEGDVSVDTVVGIVERLLELGVDEVSLGDTIGVAVPTQVREIVERLEKRGILLHRIALHLHDTRGTALANIWTGLQLGITRFDSSIGGLGGCPYAPGASGNVATDDLLYLLHKMGVTTGVSDEEVASTSDWFETLLGRSLMSHAQAVRRGVNLGGAAP